MIVISDASVFMNLAVIGHLHLLPSIFHKIIIPQGVYDEIVIKGWGKAGSKEVKDAAWIEIKRCSDHKTLNKLLEVLDKGEAEAITLALEIKADLLIVDEKRGRLIATEMEVRITGLLGVLLIAKQQGLITEVKTLMEQLREKGNFRISKATFQRVLDRAGE